MGTREEQTIERIAELEQEVQWLQNQLRSKEGGTKPVEFPLDVLVASADGSLMGLSVPQIDFISPMVLVSALPRAPRCVRGVANFHGRLVPVLDLRGSGSEEDVKLTPDLFLIFLHAAEDMFAIVADELLGVSRFEELPPQESSVPALPPFVQCLLTEGASTIPLIDPGMLLSASELNLLHEQLVYFQEREEG